MLCPRTQSSDTGSVTNLRAFTLKSINHNQLDCRIQTLIYCQNCVVSGSSTNLSIYDIKESSEVGCLPVVIVIQSEVHNLQFEWRVLLHCETQEFIVNRQVVCQIDLAVQQDLNRS